VKRDGSWIRGLRYGPYGALIADTASASAPTWELRYRWTGREYDAETGWYFLRARYYDANARRFVQEDPIGYGGGSNVFAYVDGGPLEATDPSGLDKNYDSQTVWVSNCFNLMCHFAPEDAPDWWTHFAESGFSMWDIMPPAERNAEYERYTAAYKQNDADGLFTGVAGDTKMLSLDQFGQMVSGINDLAGLTAIDPSAKLYAISKAMQFLTSGRVAANDYYVQLQAKSDQGLFLADPNRGLGVLWVNGRVLAIAALSDADNRTHWVAWGIAHEFAGHFRMALRGMTGWGDECSADRGAHAATGLDYHSSNASTCSY